MNSVDWAGELALIFYRAGPPIMKRLTLCAAAAVDNVMLKLNPRLSHRARPGDAHSIPN
jgi:hypothetical protein